MMKLIPYIFIGGGLGATLRYLITELARFTFHKSWVGTLFANLIGCILIFILFKLSLNNKAVESLIRIGFLGALTTFSTFSFEVVTHFQNGKFSEGFLILFLNIFFGIIAGVFILR